MLDKRTEKCHKLEKELKQLQHQYDRQQLEVQELNAKLLDRASELQQALTKAQEMSAFSEKL